MTAREIYSAGLIAGLTLTEMRHMFCGEIMDYFVQRRDYDMAMHQLKLGETGGLDT